MLEDGQLMDLGFLGPLFTWTKLINSQLVWVRLGKGVTKNLWRRICLEVRIENQLPTGSDCAPIILTLKPIDMFLPRPFRFEWMWTQDEWCGEEIKDKWNKPF